MAKVILNSMFEGMSGKMGDVVFRRLPNGETIMTKVPNRSNAQCSEAQKAQRQRFKEATTYAKAAMADSTVREYYEEEAIRLQKPPYSLAVSDYFKGINLLENRN